MDENAKAAIWLGVLFLIYGIATAVQNGWKPSRPHLPERPKVGIDFGYLDAIRDQAKEREHGNR